MSSPLRNEWASFCHGEVNTQMPTNWQEEFGLLWRYPCWAATPEEAAKLQGMDVSVAKDYDFSGFTNGGYREYDDELNVPKAYTIWASAQVRISVYPPLPPPPPPPLPVSSSLPLSLQLSFAP